MSTSEQLERETEEERARISETLEELRARMTPGHIVDRLVDYASDSSGGLFFRNLRQQAVHNPVPVALVGVGLAWLAVAGRRDDSSRASSNAALSQTANKMGAVGGKVADSVRQGADTASDTASRWSNQARAAAAEVGERGQTAVSGLQDRARETADAVADSASSSYTAASEVAADATSRVQGAARSAIDSVSERASTTYDAAAEQARRAGERFQNSASEMRGKVAERSRNFIDFICEQPLVLVGLGLALGAAIGAASPSSEAEEQLFERNQVKRPATSKEPQSATGDEGHGSAGDRAPHLDSGRNETPLVPSETSASREASEARLD